jgi:tetratricopeptide (TPR) repeat protein
MHAFKRAQKHREADISYAHHLRNTARSIQSFGKEITTAKRNAFCSAAEAFLRCAQCAKDKEQRVFFHNAADCFQNAGSYAKAARAYEDAKEYTPAVRLYRKTEMFDDAVRVIQDNWQEVDEGLAVLAELGRHQGAAEIRTMEAIDALLDDKKNEQSKRRANECILRGLWDNTFFSRRIEDTDAAALEFLGLAESTMDKGATLLTPTQKDEVSSEFSHFLHQLLIPFYSWKCSRVCANPMTRPHSDGSRIASLTERKPIKLCYASTTTSPNSRRLSRSPMQRWSESWGILANTAVPLVI